jgi:catechol 2,3-dioxygenase
LVKERKEQSARDDKDWDREPEQSNASKKAVTRRCTVEMTSTDRYEPKVAIDTKVKVGHVHLNVADLERSVAFYRDVLGFRVLLWLPKLAFLSAGDYPHLGLDTRATEGGKPPEPGITGLHHYALQHPTREALASTVSRAVGAGATVARTADFTISLAVFIQDPDGNMVELCWERPRSEWPDDWASAGVMGSPRPFDLPRLLAEV